jgi:hypothetical protein
MIAEPIVINCLQVSIVWPWAIYDFFIKENLDKIMHIDEH